MDPNGPPDVLEPQRTRITPRYRSHRTPSADSSPPGQTPLPVPFRYSFEIGGHLTWADDNLSSIAQRWGGGPDVTALVGPRRWPLLFGLQTGFDTFGGPTQTFRYQGSVSDYRLERTGFWLHGMVRLEPEWTIRPHLDLLAGFWVLNVGLSESGSGASTSQDSVGSAVTGSYGVGAGVRVVSRRGFSGGLSLVYLRGGAMEVPHAASAFVTDEVLYFDDRRVSNVSQVMIMLQLGLTGS